jgi:hypothetical protein
MTPYHAVQSLIQQNFANTCPISDANFFQWYNTAQVHNSTTKRSMSKSLYFSVYIQSHCLCEQQANHWKRLNLEKCLYTCIHTEDSSTTGLRTESPINRQLLEPYITSQISKSFYLSGSRPTTFNTAQNPEPVQSSSHSHNLFASDVPN